MINIFDPPSLQRQPATRKKLLHCALWATVSICCVGTFAFLNKLEQADNPPAAITALYILAAGGVLISIALLVNMANHYSALAAEQLEAELLDLPDERLLLCGQLKHQVPNDEWQIIRSVLRERWVDWDVRLSDFLERQNAQ